MSIFNDVNIGMGLQALRIDLSGSDPDLLTSAAIVRARLFSDTTAEAVTSFEAEGPAGSAAPTDIEQPSFWTEMSMGLVSATPKTFFQFAHDFRERGLYFVSIQIEDNNNRVTTAAVAIRLGVGDGLPKEIPYE